MRLGNDHETKVIPPVVVIYQEMELVKNALERLIEAVEQMEVRVQVLERRLPSP